MGLTIMYVFLKDLYIFEILNDFLILKWSSYFIAGIIFYQIYKTEINTKYTILLCISFIISTYHAVSRIEGLESHYHASHSALIIVGFIMIFYILMLLVSSGKLNFINSPKLIKIGLLTYPLYLLHQKIGFIIFNNWGTESNKYLLLLITTLFMLLLAYLISGIYELRVSNYLKRKLYLLVSKYSPKA